MSRYGRWGLGWSRLTPNHSRRISLCVCTSPRPQCWGWMDASVGRLRSSYIDFRWAQWSGVHPASTQISPDYIRHSESFIHALTSPGGYFGDSAVPDVIVMEGIGDTWRIDQVAGWVHPSYSGRILLSGPKPTPYSVLPLWQRVQAALPRHLAQRPGLNWEYVDEEFVLPMHQSSEARGRSQHMHYACTEGGKYVCGITTEMTAHLLLHHVLTTRVGTGAAGTGAAHAARLDAYVAAQMPHCRVSLGDATEPAARDAGRAAQVLAAGGVPRAVAPVNFCIQCPVQLMPFTMVSRLAPVCTNYVPQSRP